MLLITTNEQLTTMLPNIAVSVEGETPLIEKLTPFLNAAEQWVCDTFLSSAMLADIINRDVADTLRNTTTQVIVYEAFRCALPHLDVILTPNGFGIVSNTNIAPASKERISRLLDSLLENRDAAIAQLLFILCKLPQWLSTEQAEFFRATMFPNTALANRFQRIAEGRWEQYNTLRLALLPIEEHIATQYISEPLISTLRAQVQSGQFSTEKHKHICRVLQAVEVECLKDTTSTTLSSQAHRTLTQLVELIRSNPEDFPEWHESTTAQLYEPPIFENKKESKGYWF